MTDKASIGTTATKGSLLVIFLVVFIDLLGFGIVLPLLPNYAREFKTDSSGLVIGLLMSSFSAMRFCSLRHGESSLTKLDGGRCCWLVLLARSFFTLSLESLRS